MARIRSIKPELWSNEKLATVSESALILSVALLNYADDEGYFNANPGLVRAACFPIREPSREIRECLAELVEIDYIRIAEAEDGRRYGWIVGFTKHQKVDHAAKSKIKGLCEFRELSTTPREILASPREILAPDQGSGIRDQGSEKHDAASPPSVDSPIDPREIIFTLGVSILGKAGMAESSARAFLGKLAKGGESSLAEKIGWLAANPKIEPRSYLVAAMKPKERQVAA